MARMLGQVECSRIERQRVKNRTMTPSNVFPIRFLPLLQRTV